VISSLILVTTIVVLGAPSAFVFIPWAMITGNATPLYNAAQWIVRTAYRLAGIRVESVGADQVPPNTACIFMANHVSNLDPPALLPRIPGRTSAFVKRSLMKVPVFGYALKLGEFVPVDRDGRADGAIESVRAAERMLKKGLTSPLLLKARAPATAACCPSRKAPSIWPWKPARRVFLCPFMAQRP